MNKIRKTLKAIQRLITNPWLLNHVLDDNENWQRYVLQKHKITYLPQVALDEILPAFSETLHVFSFLDGSSLPTDIALLKGLCKKFQECRYFEIGTWRGESVANVALVASECYTLDLPPSEQKKYGFNAEQISQQQFFSKNMKNVIQLHGNSLNYNFSTLGKKFDVIFIDGNHHYEYVKNDTEKIFRHLVHEHSIVVWHDYAFTPEIIRYEVLAGILDGIPASCKSNLYGVSNTLCALFTTEKLQAEPFRPYSNPRINFKIQINANRITEES
jgi:predicted O-methyltransferase YrrM